MQQSNRDQGRRLTSKQVRYRYGGVSAMCLWRWMHDPKVAFPQPEKINTRNYWFEDVLNNWDDARKQVAA